MARCIVSYVDLDGVRHSVEVEAGGLYEAAILALCAFRKHEIEPGAMANLDVEARSTVTPTLNVKQAKDWLQRGVRTPKRRC